MKFYSAKTGGFYSLEINGTAIPADAVQITDAQHEALLEAQSTGKRIAPDAAGSPVAIDPPAVASVAPSSISPAQARLALLAAGLLDRVEAAVAAADRTTQIAWGQARSIERSSPTVAALSAALGLTSAQLDGLFTAGAAIRV